MIPDKRAEKKISQKNKNKLKRRGIGERRGYEIKRISEKKNSFVYFFSFQINEKVIRRGVKWFSPSFAADDLLFVSY